MSKVASVSKFSRRDTKFNIHLSIWIKIIGCNNYRILRLAVALRSLNVIKQTYLSSSVPGGNNVLAVTALDKLFSGLVLLESSVLSILREQIRNMKNFDYRITMAIHVCFIVLS